MKKLICFIFLIFLIFIIGCTNFKENKVCIKGECFNVELAKTDVGIEQGLMFRDQLDIDKGMLFIFDKEDNHPFWMKNTLIPLDLIWVNKNKEIVFISRNNQGCNENCEVIYPNVNAKYVLEINANISDNFNLGDKVDIK